MGQAECWAEELAESWKRISRFPGKEQQKQKKKADFKVGRNGREEQDRGWALTMDPNQASRQAENERRWEKDENR